MTGIEENLYKLQNINNVLLFAQYSHGKSCLNSQFIMKLRLQNTIYKIDDKTMHPHHLSKYPHMLIWLYVNSYVWQLSNRIYLYICYIISKFTCTHDRLTSYLIWCGCIRVYHANKKHIVKKRTIKNTSIKSQHLIVPRPSTRREAGWRAKTKYVLFFCCFSYATSAR